MRASHLRYGRPIFLEERNAYWKTGGKCDKNKKGEKSQESKNGNNKFTDAVKFSPLLGDGEVGAEVPDGM